MKPGIWRRNHHSSSYIFSVFFFFFFFFFCSLSLSLRFLFMRGPEEADESQAHSSGAFYWVLDWSYPFTLGPDLLTREERCDYCCFSDSFLVGPWPVRAGRAATNTMWMMLRVEWWLVGLAGLSVRPVTAVSLPFVMILNNNSNLSCKVCWC